MTSRARHLLWVSCAAACLISHAAQAEPVPDHYIVLLEGPAPQALPAAQRSAAEASIERVAARHGAAIERRYSAALRGFTARMTVTQARALARDPDVALVEQDQIVRVSAVHNNATWGLDRIDQRALPLDTRFIELGDGAGATIYVIDTGLRLTHSELTGRVLPGAYAIEDGNLTRDCNGHGTHVAGTIAGSTYGVAKKASVVPVRVLDCAGNGSIAGIVAGIDWIIANKRPQAVANLSLAAGASDALDTAVRNMISAGITTVVAAGNANTDACTVSPARVLDALTVAATTSTDARSPFSNYGTCVDLHAPGSDIVSAGLAADTAVATLSGTSMAAPHVAGVAAAFVALNPGATPAQVMTAITTHATPQQITDTKGSPNLLLNTSFLDQTAPVIAITSPQNGATVPPSFALDATVQEPNLVKLELAVDGVPYGSLAMGPFQFQVQGLAVGAHQLVLTATDLTDRTAQQSIMVTVAPSGDGSGSGSNGDHMDGGDGTNTPTGDVSGGCSATGSLPALPLVAFVLALLGLRGRSPNRCGF
jgi:hypothetical protein